MSWCPAVPVSSADAVFNASIQAEVSKGTIPDGSEVLKLRFRTAFWGVCSQCQHLEKLGDVVRGPLPDASVTLQLVISLTLNVLSACRAHITCASHVNHVGCEPAQPGLPSVAVAHCCVLPYATSVRCESHVCHVSHESHLWHGAPSCCALSR